MIIKCTHHKTTMRKFEFGSAVTILFSGENRSSRYARQLLDQIGVHTLTLNEGDVAKFPVIVAGSTSTTASQPDHDFIVRLWDFQVGRCGTGLQASIVSGVSCVIGMPHRPPLALPANIPEKWCGILGASIALSGIVQQWNPESADVAPQCFDISTADILRSFADQNFANHKEFPDSWRRNGRITLEHGGIYPQGFFPCKDGYVAVVGRSRADWETILAALGKPEWATGQLLDPVFLATHPEQVDDLFYRELARFTRDELLELALQFGATFAPVYNTQEAAAKNLVPMDLFEQPGLSGLPFSFAFPA